MPTRPTSILVVTDWFPPAIGGVEAAAWALALAVAGGGGRGGGGCRVTVLTPALPGGPVGVRAVRAPGSGSLVRIYYAPRGAGWVARASGGAAAWAPPSPAGLAPLIRAVAARERATIIHAHSTASPLALAALAVGRALCLPALLSDHSMAGRAGSAAGGGGGAAWAAAAAAVAPPTLAAVSAAAAACTAARLGRPPGSVTVLRNAIDGGSLAGAAAEHAKAAAAATAAGVASTPRPPPPPTVRVLSVSRLTARKGAAALGAAIRLAARADPGLAFTIVGEGPGAADLAGALGAVAEVGGRVRLAGARPPAAVPALLSGHHLFLSASATEAFGLAALEAAAVGLGVVSPDVGGVAQALAPAAAGAGGGRVRLVPPSAGPAGLAAAVVAAAAGLRAGWAAPPAQAQPPPPLAPLAAVLADHCWHRAGEAAVAAAAAAAARHAADPAFPPLPGRPLTAAARALLHALLVVWVGLLGLVDPPGRTGRVAVTVQSL